LPPEGSNYIDHQIQIAILAVEVLKQIHIPEKIFDPRGDFAHNQEKMVDEYGRLFTKLYRVMMAASDSSK
jgi:hypothetical protein